MSAPVSGSIARPASATCSGSGARCASISAPPSATASPWPAWSRRGRRTRRSSRASPSSAPSRSACRSGCSPAAAAIPRLAGLVAAVSLVLLSLPPLLVALLLTFVAARTGWAPTGGMQSAGADAWGARRAAPRPRAPSPRAGAGPRAAARGVFERVQQAAVADGATARHVLAASARGVGIGRWLWRALWRPTASPVVVGLRPRGRNPPQRLAGRGARHGLARPRPPDVRGARRARRAARRRLRRRRRRVPRGLDDPRRSRWRGGSTRACVRRRRRDARAARVDRRRPRARSRSSGCVALAAPLRRHQRSGDAVPRPPARAADAAARRRRRAAAGTRGPSSIRCASSIAWSAASRRTARVRSPLGFFVRGRLLAPLDEDGGPVAAARRRSPRPRRLVAPRATAPARSLGVAFAACAGALAAGARSSASSPATPAGRSTRSLMRAGGAGAGAAGALRRAGGARRAARHAPARRRSSR